MHPDEGDPALAVLVSLRGSGETVRLRTEGISMLPSIKAKGLAEIHCVDPCSLGVGDIALFHREGARILHRILRVDAGNGRVDYVEKGDHQPVYGRVTDEDVLGRLVRVVTTSSVVDPASRRGRAFGRIMVWIGRNEVRWISGKEKLPGAGRGRLGRVTMAGLRLIKWSVWHGTGLLFRS